MDEYQRAKFIRGLAQECRMHAAMAKRPEGRRRWLDSAQDYERQADQLEAITTRRVGDLREPGFPFRNFLRQSSV